MIRVNGAQGALTIPTKQANEEIEERSENLIEIADLNVNPIALGQPISGYIRADKNQNVNLNVVNVLGQRVKNNIIIYS